MQTQQYSFLVAYDSNLSFVLASNLFPNSEKKFKKIPKIAPDSQ